MKTDFFIELADYGRLISMYATRNNRFIIQGEQDEVETDYKRPFFVCNIATWKSLRQAMDSGDIGVGQKPPIGIKPELLHKEDRLKQINDAIERYRLAGHSSNIPVDWLVEKIKLENWIKNNGGLVTS